MRPIELMMNTGFDKMMGSSECATTPTIHSITAPLQEGLAMRRDSTPRPRPFKDLTGLRFGRLVVVGKSNRTDNGKTFPFWTCRCDCGVEKDVAGSALKGNLTKTCGCGRAANFRTNGLHSRFRREYAVYQSMIQRCHNPDSQGWARYGARGIVVCDRWRSGFAAFIEDMGPRPEGDYSIDRKDNGGPYSPDNCRWASRSVQGRNTRSNRLIAFRGETKTITEWSEVFGVRVDAIHARLESGWPIEDAMTIADGIARRPRDERGRFLVNESDRARKWKVNNDGTGYHWGDGTS